jgi:hypothetical protein
VGANLPPLGSGLPKGTHQISRQRGNTWVGRGAQPVWLREKLKGGAKLDDFAVKSSGCSQRFSEEHEKAPTQEVTKLIRLNR